jgi:hypothetical protein
MFKILKIGMHIRLLKEGMDGVNQLLDTSAFQNVQHEFLFVVRNMVLKLLKLK